jgi:hypothetical protein
MCSTFLAAGWRGSAQGTCPEASGTWPGTAPTAPDVPPRAAFTSSGPREVAGRASSGWCCSARAAAFPVTASLLSGVIGGPVVDLRFAEAPEQAWNLNSNRERRMNKVGRNDPCPCGSGKRYKSCHAVADRGMHRSGWIALVVATVAVVSLIALAMAYRKGPGPSPVPASPSMSGGTSVTPSTAQPTGTPGAAPPGEAPPGKVWSAEHGHWHDAPVGPTTTSIPMGTPGATPATTPGAQPVTGSITPQPPGPVPPGKVWSAEHGHWHDAPPPPAGTGGQ